jgi:hypothetical protein
MAWYDDLWSGIKSAVNVGKDVVSTVAPVLPFLLKKGQTPGDFKDTPANRKKVLKLFEKLHPHHAEKIKAYKKGGSMVVAKRGRGRPRK